MEWINSGNTCPRPYISLPLRWVWALLSYFKTHPNLWYEAGIIFLPESVLLPNTRIKAKTSKKIMLRVSKQINWTMSQRQMVKTLPGRWVLCVGPNASILSNHSALQNESAACGGMDEIQGILMSTLLHQECVRYWTIELHLLWPLQILWFYSSTACSQTLQALLQGFLHNGVVVHLQYWVCLVLVSE